MSDESQKEETKDEIHQFQDSEQESLKMMTMMRLRMILKMMK